MYSKITRKQKGLLIESYKEARSLGAIDPMQAVACAAKDVLIGESVDRWNGPDGQDAFAAALACLLMEKVISLKGKAKAKSNQEAIQKTVEQVRNYYDWPNVGWWDLKKFKAKNMSLVELDFARRDCNDTARNGMPENEGKYIDEATIYGEEMRKRVGEEVQGVH